MTKLSLATQAQVPTGALTVLYRNGRWLGLLNAARYEVADGDLIVTSRRGRARAIPAGRWAAIGTLQRSQGLTWVAIEAYGA